MQIDPLIALAGIGVLAITCQWLAWWVKLPAILFLLLTGILAGPVAGWLDPEALFGDLLFPMVSLGVAVILFEGGLTLRFDQIAGLERVVRRLVTTGLLVTWAVTAVATFLLVGLPWELSLLFGAITVVTGPTVIVPMLRTVRPSAHVASILRWEGIVIDPIGALLAVLVFEFIISGRGAPAFGHTLVTFGRVLAVGLAFGAVAGYALGQVLRRHWLPEYLHNVATLTLVFGVFAASNWLEAESGLLAVTVMGLWMANMKDVPVEDILDFKESLSILLISGLFIILAARIDLAEVRQLGWGAVGVFLVMQFIARPLKVLTASAGSSLSWRERSVLAWIAPRGIVAAAVSAIFALHLEQHGLPEARLLVPLTFLVIIGTVVLQSATARFIAGRLGVAEPEPKGFLIIGATQPARVIGKALQSKGFRVLLADSNWDSVSAARMEGLDTYYGNPVSEHADRRLDLVGIGRMLGLSPRKEINALAALRYRSEFGAGNIYTLLTSAEKESRDKARLDTAQAGRILFGENVTYAQLSTMLSQGARMRETKITEAFDFQSYYKKYYRKAIPLFAITPKAQLRVFTVAHTPDPGPGWSVMALIRKEAPKGPAKTEKKGPASRTSVERHRAPD